MGRFYFVLSSGLIDIFRYSKDQEISLPVIVGYYTKLRGRLIANGDLLIFVCATLRKNGHRYDRILNKNEIHIINETIRTHFSDSSGESEAPKVNSFPSVRPFPEEYCSTARVIPESIDYSKLLVTEEGLYSTILPEHSQQMVRVFRENINCTTGSFYDCTANVGGDLLTLLHNFPGLTAVATEIQSEQFYALQHNIEALGYDSRVETVMADARNYLKRVKDLKKQLFVYIDPPWGGSSVWKTDKPLMLYLCDTEIYKFIGEVFCEGITRTVVLKAPWNFDLFSLRVYLKSVGVGNFYIKKEEIKKKTGKIAYLLFFIFSNPPLERFRQIPKSSELESKVTQFIRKATATVGATATIFQMISELSRQGCTDEVVINKLGDLYSNFQKKNTNANADAAVYNEGRAKSRVEDILPTLARYLPNVGIENYLDIGCGEGRLTKAIAKAIETDNAYAIDTHPIPLTRAGTPGADGFEFTVADSISIPFEADTFDIVSFIQSLHHFPEPIKSLNEAWRVLKDRGLVVIREHDVRDRDTAIFLDIVHYLYAAVFNKEIPFEKFKCRETRAQLSGSYNGERTWRQAFENAGFEHLETIRPKKDLFNSYYAIFRKKSL